MRRPLPTPQATAVSDAKIASVLSAAVEVHPPANPVDATLPTPFPTDGDNPVCLVALSPISLPVRVLSCIFEEGRHPRDRVSNDAFNSRTPISIRNLVDPSSKVLSMRLTLCKV